MKWTLVFIVFLAGCAGKRALRVSESQVAIPMPDCKATNERIVCKCAAFNLMLDAKEGRVVAKCP